FGYACLSVWMIVAVRAVSAIANIALLAYNGTTFTYEATFTAYFPNILRKDLFFARKLLSLDAASCTRRLQPFSVVY
ncbi:MAG: hypothetical protein NTY06_02450, partial [Candidatus Gottesmanbacteria bacterium]|nr:hypothetical protein [Candidatus Gottesmanbacteria bacterium]